MDKPTIITSSLTLLDTNVAVASLNGEQRDHLFMNDQMKMAIGREVKEDDFLYFAFKLCHAGKNNNKDIFTLEEFKKDVTKRRGLVMPSWKTPEGEPVDYDHNFGFPAIVGDIYQSLLVESPAPEDDDRPYIKCAGVIYRGLYPDVAFKVARGSRLGYAKVSMEVKFAAGIPTHEGRMLRGLNFKGAALTRMPADVDADIDPLAARAAEAQPDLAVAADTTEISVGTKMMTVPSSFLKK